MPKKNEDSVVDPETKKLLIRLYSAEMDEPGKGPVVDLRLRKVAKTFRAKAHQVGKPKKGQIEGLWSMTNLDTGRHWTLLGAKSGSEIMLRSEPHPGNADGGSLFFLTKDKKGYEGMRAIFRAVRGKAKKKKLRARA